MKRKNKRCRKATLQSLGETANGNKENSFSNIFCRKPIPNSRKLSSEPATRSCSFSKRSNKQNKQGKDDCCKAEQLQFVSNAKNSAIMLISSVAFFIPLNDYAYHIKKKNSSPKIIDWSTLMFYGCKNSSCIPDPPEQMSKFHFLQPTVLPDLKLKYRTTSESSNNSQDSFISFENSEDLCKQCNYKMLKRTRHKAKAKNIKFHETQPEEKRTQKKKVQFVENTELVTVHRIIAWDYAYRAARISPWVVMARDSRRFKQKIISSESVLNPILTPQHRAKIWEARMKDFQPL